MAKTPTGPAETTTVPSTTRTSGGLLFFVALLVVTIVGALVLSWDMLRTDKAETDQLPGPDRYGLLDD